LTVNKLQFNRERREQLPRLTIVQLNDINTTNLMKKHFSSKTLIALAVAIAAAAGYENLVSAQPIPPPATVAALPAGIQPGTPVAEVVKLAQAGVDASVIQNYIATCPGDFNITADEIISLTDAGVSSDMVNAMIAHDKNLAASVVQPTVPSPAPTDNTDITPPPTDLTQADFDNTLSPYGQWIQVDGYGRCWRPTTVVYDATWQPYCDRGRWVYTDCGWYWDSDYSWGVTFHYGRWFNTPNYGWCWWPDTVWAPSWVTWRSSGDYCGWAPLPPYTAYQPGIGFTYRGANVAVSFGFGLPANCFTFVSIGNFCQPHPRYYCVPRQQVTVVYNQTTIVNNYNYHNRTIVNNGVSVTAIGTAARRPIQPVSVGAVVSARNHGWSAGNPSQNPVRYGAGGVNNNQVPTQGNGGENSYRQNPGINNVNTGHRPPYNPATQPANRAGEAAPSSRPQNYGTPSNQQNQRQSGWSGRNENTVPAQNYSQPPPHNVAPVAPTSSTATQNQPASTGGRGPGWMSQNH
jgi:hypothetical protein